MRKRTEPTESSGWGVLVITLAIQAMVSMAVLTIPVIAPAMAHHLQASPTLVGGYVALAYAAAMAGSLSAAQLVARHGAIRTSQAGLLLCAAGLALSALPSAPAVGLGAILIGLGYGPITPASSHLLAISTPPHRASLIFSIKQTGVPLGGMLAGGIAPGLVLLGGAPAALLQIAGAIVVCACIAQPLRRLHDSDRRVGASGFALRSLTGPLRLVAAHPELRRLAALSFVFSAIQLCLSAYLVVHLHTSLGYSLIVAGLALSVAQGGGVLGRVVWGYVADRWLGARWTLAALAALMAACTVATSLLQAPVPMPLVLALVACFGASATGWNGVFLAEVARLAPPGLASTATGGTLFVTYFGVVTGPLLFAAVSGLFGGYGAGYLALALPAALCCWSLLLGGRRATKPGAAERAP